MRKHGHAENHLEFIDLHTRVTCIAVIELGSASGQSVGVLVKDDITVILNELAFLEHPVHLPPPTRGTLQHEASLFQALAERSGSFPSVIVWYLATHVMQDMGFRDAMSGVGSYPSHDRTAITKQAAI